MKLGARAASCVRPVVRVRASLEKAKIGPSRGGSKSCRKERFGVRKYPSISRRALETSQMCPNTYIPLASSYRTVHVSRYRRAHIAGTRGTWTTRPCMRAVHETQHCRKYPLTCGVNASQLHSITFCRLVHASSVATSQRRFGARAPHSPQRCSWQVDEPTYIIRLRSDCIHTPSHDCIDRSIVRVCMYGSRRAV